jgi:hypothetical protein
MLACESSDDLIRGNKGYDAYSGSFDRLSSTLLTVDQRQDTGYESLCVAHGFDRAQRGTAGGYYVFYNGDSISLSEGAFENLSRTMSFRLFSYRECT